MSDDGTQPKNETKSYAGFAVILGVAVVAALLFPAAIEILDGPPPEATETVEETAEAPVLAGAAAPTDGIEASETPTAGATNEETRATTEPAAAPLTQDTDGGDEATIATDTGDPSEAETIGAETTETERTAEALKTAPSAEPTALAQLPQDTGDVPSAEAEEPAAKPTVAILSLPEEVEEPSVEEKAPDAQTVEEPSAEEPNSEPVAPTITTQIVEDADDAGDEINARAPEFDVVRVDPDGATLVAGTATPNAPVAIVVDGVEQARVQAGSDGAFVAFADLASTNAPQIISLVEAPEAGGPSSIEDIIVALSIPEPSNVTEEPQVTEELPSQPVVLKAAPQGLSLIQPAQPLGEAPKAASTPAAPETELPNIGPTAPPLSLDSISYNDAGEVQIAGRTTEGGRLRIYLDNALLAETDVERGNWGTSLPPIEPGTYTLRVDRVGTDGAVRSRVETPFKRETPEVLAEFVTDDPNFTVKTVQPGATLWAIARERYGRGIEYIKVFEANRDRIKDPDLIYPGQVFTIPD